MDVTLLNKTLRKFTISSYPKAIGQILNALIPTVLLFALSFYLYYNPSAAWLFLTTPITAAFMVRLFMLFHDCGHQSFTQNRKVNNIIGRLLGFFYFVPFSVWVNFHNKHHATSGNLDERDILDLIVLTTEEYNDLNSLKQKLYKFYRSFVGRFLVINQLTFLLAFRVPALLYSKKGAIGILINNFLYVLLFWGLSFYVNLWDVFIVLFPVYYIVFGVGSFLFYLQHTFEDAYWERSENWNFHELAVQGSSFWDVPKIIHWFTGNIGYHHIHHLNLYIPNYNLPAAHEWLMQTNTPIRNIGFLESLTLTNYNLWDEEQKKMTDF